MGWNAVKRGMLVAMNSNLLQRLDQLIAQSMEPVSALDTVSLISARKALVESIRIQYDIEWHEHNAYRLAANASSASSSAKEPVAQDAVAMKPGEVADTIAP